MEDEEIPDPLELCKNPKVIQAAQEEIGKLDVLVCGECHDVFHYIEPFKEHRENEKCTGISVVRDNYKNEPKAQVWAFMLWKNAQFKKAKDGENIPTSWIVYQRWCKLNSEEKDAWVAAGQTIQSFTKISTAKIQEVKNKTQVGTNLKNKSTKAGSNTVVVAKGNDDQDPLEEGEIRLSNLTNAQKIAIKAQVATNKGSKTDLDPLEETMKKIIDSSNNKNTEKKAITSENTEQNLDKMKSADSKKALRTNTNGVVEEMAVNKLLSRRYNHTKNYMEYLVKWEKLNDSQNTWEPKKHLENCKTLLEEFHKRFGVKKITTKVEKGSPSEHSDPEETPTGRPQRTSKQKAMNQVKAWCGDITDSDEPTGKRKFYSDEEEDDDSSDSFEKRIKLEEDSESSEEEKPAVTIRRVMKTSNFLNGVSPKPEPTFSAAPQRVVRVSQKQLPSLSSGVYIMSKTEGIIKLDSNTAPTTGPLLKIGPKIGQSQIRMLKKDGGAAGNVKTLPRLAPKLLKTPETKPFVKSGTKLLAPRKAMTVSTFKPIATVLENKQSPPQKVIEEDSDGLEELEFPTDLPLPTPDSPPSDFTLCPLTGKIVGQNYEEEQVNTTECGTESTALDHLVELAVAELPEVDSNTDTELKEVEAVASTITTNSLVNNSIKVEPKTSSVVSVVATSPAFKSKCVNSVNQVRFLSESKIATKDDIEECLTPTTIEKMTPKKQVVSAPKPKTSAGASILNAALTNPNVGQQMAPPKKLLSTTPHTIRQKVMGANRSPTTSRPSPSSTIIHKISPNRNKTQTMMTKILEPQPILKRTSNVATYKSANVARRIGNTTIYKTPAKQQPATNRKQPPSTSIVSPITQSSLVTTSGLQTSSTVINMPLLTTDEESTSSEQVAATPETTSTVENQLSNLSTFTVPESDTPILITGDDGTIYQVAGQNEEGQTILISQGPDGEQQCVLVSSEPSSEEQQPASMVEAEDVEANELDETLISTQSEDAEGDGGEESQVVAQIIKADPPSPGIMDISGAIDSIMTEPACTFLDVTVQAGRCILHAFISAIIHRWNQKRRTDAARWKFNDDGRNSRAICSIRA